MQPAGGNKCAHPWYSIICEAREVLEELFGQNKNGYHREFLKLDSQLHMKIICLSCSFLWGHGLTSIDHENGLIEPRSSCYCGGLCSL